MSDNRGSASLSKTVVTVVNLNDEIIAAQCGSPVERKITFSGCHTCTGLFHCMIKEALCFPKSFILFSIVFQLLVLHRGVSMKLRGF